MSELYCCYLFHHTGDLVDCVTVGNGVGDLVTGGCDTLGELVPGTALVALQNCKPVLKARHTALFATQLGTVTHGPLNSTFDDASDAPGVVLRSSTRRFVNDASASSGTSPLTLLFGR